MNLAKINSLSNNSYDIVGDESILSKQSEKSLQFFYSVTKQIIDGVGPSSALDIGCGKGILVKCLRQQGVKAFGLDISQHPTQQVHPDVKSYCWVGSVLYPLPQKYDLITCIEVLEHLSKSEIRQAIENLCQHCDDILFSSTPFDYKEPTHFNVQPPEYWAQLFAYQGFFRDLNFDASFITPWTARFRRAKITPVRVITSYERRLWQLTQENQARRDYGIEQRNELAAIEQRLQHLNQAVKDRDETIQALQARWTQLEASPGWTLLQKLQSWRATLAPPASVRDQTLTDVIEAFRTKRIKPLLQATYRLNRDLSWHIKVLWWQSLLRLNPPKSDDLLNVDEISDRPSVQSHQSQVEIIICVHNALTEVTNCLDSVVQHTNQPYQLVLVDDGSDSPTKNYLIEFAQEQRCALLRNETPAGYTIAANQGLRKTSGDYVVLLNSDTVVTPGWLDRLIDCVESDPQIGMVGPLSNTASWQSIPNIESQGDWAANPLPPNLTIEEMGQLINQHTDRLYPVMPFLNGFCLLIRQKVIHEVGYFDEENFGAGYGEENDYALRARKAGWKLALADNVYIYHNQSRSYSHEKRRQLSERANTLLIQKHGQQIINDGVTFCRQDRTLEGIRARSKAMVARQDWIKKGRAEFSGRRVLFVLPVFRPGGGANVVIDEAKAMRQMGVDVRLFNLVGLRKKFERSYPDLNIPVLFGEKKQLSILAKEYDAIIATFHASVKWLLPIATKEGWPIRGYYIQDFEPYMYSTEADGYQAAWSSYSLLPDLVRFTKTEWTQQEVQKQTNTLCSTIGASINIDLFRPRSRTGPEWPKRPLRIGAMIRADSPHRNPELTMKILRQVAKKYGGSVEVMMFGTDLNDPGFSKLPRNFAWKLAGVLNQKQVANFLNEVDIFVDFSTHQAMGLTAMEAMACGAAVIVPQQGGAISFAKHEENSLVIDTASSEACWQALQRLIDDHNLRMRLQHQALIDICNFYPEKPAFNILQALFNPTLGETP